MEKQDNNFEINLFEINEDSGFNKIIDEINDDDTGADTSDTDGADSTGSDVEGSNEDDQIRAGDDSEEEEVDAEENENDDDDDEGKDEDGSDADDSTDDNTDDEFSDVDKAIHSYVEKGYLLLPDDYEYEDTPEAIAKAFEDSEQYRNQLAFAEAVNFLTSDKGLDMVKIKESKVKAVKYSELNPDEAGDDVKKATILEFHKKAGLDDDEALEKYDDLVELDKVDKEFKRVLGRLQKAEEKVNVQEAQAARKRYEDDKKAYDEAKNLLEKTLKETSDYNGYTINSKNQKSIMAAVYEPVKEEDGNVTTEFNKRLQVALSRPDTFLVIADLLMGMNEKGFDFSSMMDKATTQATKTVKKTLRKKVNTSPKAKVSGKQSTSAKEFDLSEATFLNFNK